MIAVDDEGLDPLLIQARQPVPESHLGLHGPIRAVVHVPGDDHEGSVLRYAEFDQVGVRLVGGVFQALGYPRLVLEQALERAVYVQVCCVYESEGLHFGVDCSNAPGKFRLSLSQVWALASNPGREKGPLLCGGQEPGRVE